MFCVECGKENVLLYEGVCGECLVRTRRLVRFPNEVRVEICAHCGSRRRGNQWEDFAGTRESALESELRRNVEVAKEVSSFGLSAAINSEDPHNYDVRAVATGLVGDVPIRVEGRPRGRLRIGTCTRCSRVFGGYYEAIIQLRSEGEIREDQIERGGAILSRVLDRMQAEGNRDAFLMQSKEEKGGVDYYLGTTASARVVVKALVDELGARVRESASLVGRREGEELYRVTFLARVPAYTIGGYVGFEERVLRVHSMSSKIVTLVDLATGRHETHERDKLSQAQVFAPEEIRSAVVVSETEKEIQILDPDTMRTIDLAKPKVFVRGEVEVRVVRWQNHWVVLP